MLLLTRERQDLVSAIRRRLCAIRPLVMYRIHRIGIDTHHLPSAAAVPFPVPNSAQYRSRITPFRREEHIRHLRRPSAYVCDLGAYFGVVVNSASTWGGGYVCTEARAR